MSEQRPLLETDPEANMKAAASMHRTLLGSHVVNDGLGWHYIMVFNRPKNKTDTVADAQGILKACFTQRALESWTAEDPQFFDKILEGPLPREVLLANVWKRITSILQGKSCGFSLGYRPSVDEEKTLLYIKSGDKATIDQLADRVGIRIRITPNAYASQGLECPQLPRTIGQRLGFNKSPPKFAPLYMKYESVRKEQFKAANQQRLKSAEGHIDNILEMWESKHAEAKREVRRLMRLEDVRAAAFVVIMRRVKDVELHKDTKKIENHRKMFMEMNEIYERSDPDLSVEMAPLTPEEQLERREQRWSPPNFPDYEAYLAADLYDELTDLDLLRLMKRRMAQFFDVAALEKHGVVHALFPPHIHKEVVKLSEEWASLHPKHIFQWPGSRYKDLVRNYFGEEVGFFFDWLAYQTRSLLWPAMLSIVSLSAPLWLAEEYNSMMRDAFALMMVGWVTFLTATYDQTMTTRNIEWGMIGYADKGMVRSNYDPKLRGSMRETVIRLLHWLLVFVFVGQTIVSAFQIAAFRHDVLHDPEGYTSLAFGYKMSNTTAAALALYAVTFNIKIMNALWDFLSPRITAYENWRTDQLMKNNEVTKSFLVKCVVYYYPFFYLAFLRGPVENAVPERCLIELRKNLMVFIIVHILTVVANICVQLAMTAWNERQMHLKAKGRNNGGEIEYTYVQAQAVRPEYAGDTADYMELSIMLGFISMFSVVFPFAACLALLSNLIETRVLAFRMCRVVRRPVPRGQEGIGAWITVMRLLTFLACITSVALLIFELQPMRSKEEMFKLSAFIVAEHTMLLVVYLMGKAVPSKSVSTEKIMERNDLAEDRILGSDSKQVVAPLGNFSCLKQGADDKTPEKAVS